MMEPSPCSLASQPPISAVLLVRNVRPLAPVIGFVAYVVYRCCCSDDVSDDTTNNNSSLLAELVFWSTRGRHLLQSYLLETSDHHHALLLLLLPYSELLWSACLFVWRLCEDTMAIMAVMGLLRLMYVLYHFSLKDWKAMIVMETFDWMKNNLWFVRDELDRQGDKEKNKIASLLNKSPDRTVTLTLPHKGRPHADLVRELRGNAEQEDKRWAGGKVSGTVYQGSRDHAQLMSDAFAAYCWSNPLHPGFWPKLNQCEGEVIAMTANMMHAPAYDEGGAAGTNNTTTTTAAGIGCITSGGTESILLAIRAHFNVYGRARGITHPELICGSTAHAAVDKACEIYGIRKVMIECTAAANDFELDPRQVQRRITSNTIMIYASAPCYPQGVIDPISKLSNLAQQYDIGLHVDACLGGFVLPFCDDDEDEEVPIFDFRNPGVTSMSADTHKFGYASKGTSVVLYRDKKLRHGQYFCYPHWTGGMYATPTFAGSRPGALAACAWASLMAMGREGYRSRARAIVKAARVLARGVEQTPGLVLLTKKQRPYMVVCFAAADSNELDIYRVQDYLSERGGWALNTMQSPASIHMCVTLNVVPRVEELIKDLQVAVTLARKEGANGRKHGTAGIYGTVGALPAGAVEPALKVFTDLTLAP